MMNKKEIIEEMKQILVNYALKNDLCFSFDVMHNHAKTLYNAGCRIISKGSVVLDKYEYQEYSAYKIIEPQIKGCLDREKQLEKRIAELEQDLIHAHENVFYRETNVVLREKEIKQQASKETVKEILQEVGKACGDYQWFKNICKKYVDEVDKDE